MKCPYEDLFNRLSDMLAILIGVVIFGFIMLIFAGYALLLISPLLVPSMILVSAANKRARRTCGITLAFWKTSFALTAFFAGLAGIAYHFSLHWPKLQAMQWRFIGFCVICIILGGPIGFGIGKQKNLLPPWWSKWPLACSVVLALVVIGAFTELGVTHGENVRRTEQINASQRQHAQQEALAETATLINLVTNQAWLAAQPYIEKDQWDQVQKTLTYRIRFPDGLPNDDKTRIANMARNYPGDWETATKAAGAAAESQLQERERCEAVDLQPFLQPAIDALKTKAWTAIQPNIQARRWSQAEWQINQIMHTMWLGGEREKQLQLLQANPQSGLNAAVEAARKELQARLSSLSSQPTLARDHSTTM